MASSRNNCILLLGLGLLLVLTAHHAIAAHAASTSGVVSDSKTLARMRKAMETRPHPSPAAPRNLPRSFMSTSNVGTRRPTVSGEQKETGN